LDYLPGFFSSIVVAAFAYKEAMCSDDPCSCELLPFRKSMTYHLFAAIAAMVLPIGAPFAATQDEKAPVDTDAAARPGAEHPAPQGRELNGHLFVPAATVRGPFTVTSFGSFMNLGYGSTTGTFQIGDRVFNQGFDYALFGATLDYELAFLRYFSARLALAPDVFSGINGSSAIAVGSRLQVQVSTGLTASIPLGDAVRVGFLLDAGFGPNVGLSIGQGIRSVIDSCRQPSGCDIDTGQVFSITHVFTLQPAAAVSWAPLPSLGLTASLAYLYATDTTSGSSFNGQAVVSGFAADFDFGRISSVPIGIQAQFRWTAPFSGTQLQHVTDLGGGVFYTGRRELAVGLQLIFRRAAVTGDVDISWSNFLTTIGLRYYW
jgi:hypothetical protein